MIDVVHQLVNEVAELKKQVAEIKATCEKPAAPKVDKKPKE
jgi:hypothetical protein